MPSVLVIGDEADVRDAIRAVLGRAGFTVRTADSGRGGVDDFIADPADVVIVDIIMPCVSGIEVIKSIRMSFPGARILAVTGSEYLRSHRYRSGTIVIDAYLAAAGQSGADAVMTKPFDHDGLIALVRSLVKN